MNLREVGGQGGANHINTVLKYEVLKAIATPKPV